MKNRNLQHEKRVKKNKPNKIVASLAMGRGMNRKINPNGNATYVLYKSII